MMKGSDFLTIVILSWLFGNSDLFKFRYWFQKSDDVVVPGNSSTCEKRFGFRIEPMAGKTMGANVYGFDVTSSLDDEDVIAEIQRALEKNLVLVFHNVTQNLSPEDHVRFSKMFGPVDPEISSPPSYLLKGKFNSPDQVRFAETNGIGMSALGKSMLAAAANSPFPKEITRVVKEPNDIVAFGEGWHSDLTYRSASPFAAILVSRELPPSGGETLFADMRVAYERLPDDIRETIEKLDANHTDGHDIWTLHPVVRHDNKYGRNSLFVNKAFTRHLVRRSSADSDIIDDQLLYKLLDYIDNLETLHPDTNLKVEWSPGQMVMWDNRFTQHAAVGGNYRGRREMHRTIVSGTTPF